MLMDHPYTTKPSVGIHIYVYVYERIYMSVRKKSLRYIYS